MPDPVIPVPLISGELPELMSEVLMVVEVIVLELTVTELTVPAVIVPKFADIALSEPTRRFDK
jgi:hypothetical protein